MLLRQVWPPAGCARRVVPHDPLPHERVLLSLPDPARLTLTLAIVRGVGNYGAGLHVGADERGGGRRAREPGAPAKHRR